MQSKLVHSAERAAFKSVLDGFIRKGQKEDASEMAESLISLIEKIMKGSWSDDSFATLRMIAEDTDNKWAHYANRLIKNTDPKILSSFLLNAAYEGGFRGFKTSEEMSETATCTARDAGQRNTVTNRI